MLFYGDESPMNNFRFCVSIQKWIDLCKNWHCLFSHSHIGAADGLVVREFPLQSESYGFESQL